MSVQSDDVNISLYLCVCVCVFVCLFVCIGLFVGVKLFIVDNIYRKYPKARNSNLRLRVIAFTWIKYTHSLTISPGTRIAP